MKPKPYRIPEKVVQAHIVRALQTVGAHVYVLGRPGMRDRRCPGCHTVVRVEQGTRQTPGIPDLLAFLQASPKGHPGHQLWIEVKAAGGKRSDDQTTFAAYCELTSQPYLTGGLDVVLDYLQRHGYIREVAHYRRIDAPQDPAATPADAPAAPGARVPRRARARRLGSEGVDPGQ